MPKPSFRPVRESNPSSASVNESKSSLPIIEQTRPWQKSGNETPPPLDHQLKTQTRSATAQSKPSQTRLVQQAVSPSQPRSIADLPNVERKTVPATGSVLSRPAPRPANAPATATEAPARVLNFSIN
jgi:hypothetical protein